MSFARACALQVLLFEGWFEEFVRDSGAEDRRVRYVQFSFFTEDNSVSIAEKYIENSGLAQGVLLKRQVLSNEATGRPYEATDFNPGADLRIFGRSYRV